MPRYSEKKRAMVDAMMRDEVFEASSRILEQEGVTALTMDRVASEVGVSRATLYNYFKDWAALVEYIKDRLMGPLLEEAEGIVKGALSPRKKLESLSWAVFSHVYNNRSLALALFSTEATRALSEASRHKHRKTVLAWIRDILEAGMACGDFRRMPSDVAAEGFLGALEGVVDVTWISGEVREPASVVPLFMDFVMGGLRPE